MLSIPESLSEGLSSTRKIFAKKRTTFLLREKMRNWQDQRYVTVRTKMLESLKSDVLSSFESTSTNCNLVCSQVMVDMEIYQLH